MANRAYLAHYINPVVLEPGHITVVAPDVVPTAGAAVVHVVAPDAFYAIRVDEGLIHVVAPDVSIPAGILDPVPGYAHGSVILLSPGTVERPPLVDPFIPDVNPLPPDDDEIEVPLPPWIEDPDGGPVRRS